MEQHEPERASTLRLRGSCSAGGAVALEKGRCVVPEITLQHPEDFTERLPTTGSGPEERVRGQQFAA